MDEVVRRSRHEHDYTVFTPNVVERDWALRPATTAIAVAREERRIAAAINAGSFDLAFVHGCRVMQAPGVLTRLDVPTVYMCQEPRRRSFERGYRPGAKSRAGMAATAWRAGSTAYDWAIGHRDRRRAVAAASAVACNSVFSAEYIALRISTRRNGLLCGGGPRHVHTGRRPAAHALPQCRCHRRDQGPRPGNRSHRPARRRRSPSFGRGRTPFERRSDRRAKQQARGAGVELDMRHGISERELVELYRGAAATLCLARLEPFGLTVPESTSSGTPVVAVREGFA